MKQFLNIFAFLLFTNTISATEETDLSLISINNIGANLLSKIKTHENIKWWVEMGDKMVIAVNPEKINSLPKHITIIATQKNIDSENLAFQSLGHCNHTGEQEKIHQTLDIVFANSSHQIVKTDGNSPKGIFEHSLIKSFTKNHVLSYQYSNRQHDKVNKADQQMQSLLDKVDKDRWFTQVEYLASLNRMLDADLLIAADWLKDKFTDLGLDASTKLVTNRRGANIIGFKQGTTRPNDWYVVGAHIDSRNQPWNDDLRSPGAEDNASGCSGVLEIANVITQFETDASILFMCFTSEETGLHGSRSLVNDMITDGSISKVKTMLNMDMISFRLGGRNVAIAGTNTGSYESLASTIADFGSQYTDVDWRVSLTMCCTDFLSFSDAGIPAVTSNQPDISTYFGYHSINDLPENLDPVLGTDIVKANLATLADLAGIDFESGSTAFQITGFQSGSWYNPEQSGHGLNLEILPNNRIQAFWYTYDNDGNQMWLAGLGTYENTTATLDVIIAENGIFPPNFIAEDITRTPWGTFQLEFSDCNTGNFSWTPNIEVDFTAGELPLTRLTKIADLTCISEE